MIATRKLLGLALLAGGLTLGGSAQATPGRRAVAPGRVVFPVDGGVTSANADGGGATEVVALPNGGAVLIGSGTAARKAFYAAELTPGGALDPSFGKAGTERVGLGRAAHVVQLLRQPDGKLIVVASSTTAGRPLLVARLSADGNLDQSFGSGGIAQVPIAGACDTCTTAALTPTGELMLTGETITDSPAWALARLTPAGAVDQSFAPGGVVTIPAIDAGGHDIAVLDNGDIMTLGFENISAGDKAIALVTRLTGMGLPELDYNGGTPAELPPGFGASAIFVFPDGTAVVGGSTALVRFTSVGAPDPSFGNNGIARVGALPFPLQLLPGAGGALLAVGRASGAPSTLNAVRVSAAGSIDPSLGGPAGVAYRTNFGGGRSSGLSGARPRGVPPLKQNSFVAGSVAIRADGSYLAVGGVSVVEPTGAGQGRSIFDFAATALTPGFTEDRGFGGRSKRLTVKLSVVAQAAGTARSKHGIRVRVDASAPGLADVVIKASGRVIARSVVPIFGSGRRTLAVELTAVGSALLAGQPGVRVTATATARDLLGATAHASAGGTLR